MNPPEESIGSPVSEPSEENPNPMTLSFGLESGETFLMPYMQLAYCHLQYGQDGDELAIVFATHTFVLKGRRQDDLLSGLQDFSLLGVNVVSGPDNGEDGSPGTPLPEGVVITSITVMSRDEGGE